MENEMFRYLEKYVGTYRVLAHYDESVNNFPRNDAGGLDESFDDLYIPCAKGRGEIRHTYRPGILAFYCPKITVAKNLIKTIEAKKHPIFFEFEDCGEEALIYFKETDLNYFAKLVSARTSGKNIKPYSSKNLDKKESPEEVVVTIPQEELDRYTSIISSAPKSRKMIFAKLIIKDFLDKLLIDQSLKEKKEELDLDPKSFIYYTGNWDAFIQFAEEQAKKEFA